MHACANDIARRALGLTIETVRQNTTLIFCIGNTLQITKGTIHHYICILLQKLT